MNPFTDALAVREIEPGRRYEGGLDERWTIGPKLHGGAILALVASAARAACPQPEQQPIAVSANFLSAPDPGAMHLVTVIRKQGRRISVIDVELVQGDRAAVHAVVTMGQPEARHDPLLTARPVVDLMAPEPPADLRSISPGHQFSGLMNLAECCDIRPVLSSVNPIIGPDGRESPPVIQIWVRPREGAPDTLFALMCSDLSVPVTFAVERYGWAPTVQFTALLREPPADGWLRVLCSSVEIGQDWFDEDHTVVDQGGRLVVQSRQLAMVPRQP